MQFLVVSSSCHLGNAGVPNLLYCSGCFVLFLFGQAVLQALTIKIKIKIHRHHHHHHYHHHQVLGSNPTKAGEEEEKYEVESSRWAFINMQRIANKVEEVKELMDREKIGLLGKA